MEALNEINPYFENLCLRLIIGIITGYCRLNHNLKINRINGGIILQYIVKGCNEEVETSEHSLSEFLHFFC